MDYIGYKCPICQKNFHADDDIVVCPLCGTPHHRECYAKNGNCINVDKHGSDFDFLSSEENSDVPAGSIKCKVCGNINPQGIFFCTQCKTPLVDISQQNHDVKNPDTSKENKFDSSFNFPFGNSDEDNSTGAFNYRSFQIDPMAGVSPDAEFENGAKAGEVAKYVKQNTSYFMQVFNKIKNFGKSKFSFVGLIFGGGYFLYRKQYLLGTILTLIMGACVIFYTYGSYEILSNLSKENVTVNSYSQLSMMIAEKAEKMDPLVIATLAAQLINYTIHIICGFIANRCYYKHCCKQVNKIKSTAKDSIQSDNNLQTKGGVNMALCLSLMAVWLIIDIVPSMLL